MPLITDFDWKSPDYVSVFRKRVEFLVRIRANPKELPNLKLYYRDNPADFIADWGCTVDPRNVERGLPSVIPFILFPKQKEWIEYTVRKWKEQQPALTEKSRDMGVSWLSVSLACTLCLFYEGMAVGFGSRKEEYVDKIGAPKSLFYKARMFMANLPSEFRGGWNAETDAPHLRLNFPETGSNISGEAGDNIGRGDRTGIYFVDESAYLERPQLIEASLSQTTNCRHDLSSVNGMANPFAEKRHSGKVEVFIFDWRDDPRKDETWYQKQEDELDPVTLAQEVNRNYLASVEGVVIPYEWARAAIDAHVKLGIAPSGARTGSLDIADEGRDKNAFCGAHGIIVETMEEWSGKGSDTFYTMEKAFGLCDIGQFGKFRYDADGIGALARGDARVINEKRKKLGQPQIEVIPFRGSGAVVDPEKEDVKGRKNEDYFANAKAQSWWALRLRLQQTFRAVVQGKPYDPNEIVSFSSTMRLCNKLVVELSQPTYTINTVGKIVIDKAPDGAMSPNLADSVMMQFSRMKHGPMIISKSMVNRAAMPSAPRTLTPSPARPYTGMRPR